MDSQCDCPKQSRLAVHAAFIWAQPVAISASPVTSFMWYLWRVVPAFLAKSVKTAENTPLVLGYYCPILQKRSLDEMKMNQTQDLLVYDMLFDSSRDASYTFAQKRFFMFMEDATDKNIHLENTQV